MNKEERPLLQHELYTTKDDNLCHQRPALGHFGKGFVLDWGGGEAVRQT